MTRLGVIYVIAWLVGAGALVTPIPNRQVQDFAQLLGPKDERALEDKLQARKRETNSQADVITVRSLAAMSVEDYTTAVFKSWQLLQQPQCRRKSLYAH